MIALRLYSGSPYPLSCILALVFVAACNQGEGAPVRQNGNPSQGQGQRGPGGGGGGPRGPGGPGGPGGPFGRPSGPAAVEVLPIRTGSLAREIMVAGILSPVRTVGVNAQLGGALTSVRVEEGDIVREGQVLAEVDARELAAQLRSAQASLELAKSTDRKSVV